MTDPIGTTASALTIADKVSSVVRWLLKRLRRAPAEPPRHEPAHDFEIRPVTFSIDLLQAIPSVELRYYAINHLSCDLMLHEIKITRFQLSGGPTIEQIPLLQDFLIPPKNTVMVVCRRNLLDSEARAVVGTISSKVGSFSLVARAKHGRREYTYGPVTSIWIEGWINRLQA